METSKKTWLKQYLNYTENGRVQKIIASATAEALTTFCEQEPEFLQAVEQSGKTFDECLTHISSGVSASKPGISDMEVFKKAVQFYFSEADIKVVMTIDMCGKVEAEGKKKYEKPEVIEAPPVPEKSKPKKMALSLDDLIDF